MWLHEVYLFGEFRASLLDYYRTLVPEYLSCGGRDEKVTQYSGLFANTNIHHLVSQQMHKSTNRE